MREIQEIIDELRHALAGASHVLQTILALGIEFVGVRLQQRPAEHIDSAERCAQIVRDRIGEGFKF